MAYTTVRISSAAGADLDEGKALLPAHVLASIENGDQRAIPAFAKDTALTASIERVVQQVHTEHTLTLGDSRRLDDLPAESVHLVLTSPPYWTPSHIRRSKNSWG